MDFFTLSVPPCFVSLSPEPPQPLSTQALAEGSPENQKNNARDLPSPKKLKKSALTRPEIQKITPETFRGLKNQKISPDTPREPKNHARDLPSPNKSKQSPREPKNHARDLPRPPKSKKSAQTRPENQNAPSETLRGLQTQKNQPSHAPRTKKPVPRPSEASKIKKISPAMPREPKNPFRDPPRPQNRENNH